jgi:hypothetical protein
MKQLWIIGMDFGETDELLIIYSAFAKHLIKNVNTKQPYISHL